MTIVYPGAATPRHGAFGALSRFPQWLAGLFAQWGRWCDNSAVKIVLDDLSVEQLEDIGIRRIKGSVTWLDDHETRFSTPFEYHAVPQERAQV